MLGSSFSFPVKGLGVWKNNELHAVSNGAWNRYSGGTWSSLASGLNTAAEWSFANFDGSFPGINLIGANGVDPIKVYDGATVANLAGAPANGNYIINYMNRAFCAVGNLLQASELNIATNWTTIVGNDVDPYTISVDTTDGETINALKPGIGHVTIFKPNSMHELFGSDPSNVRIEPITFEVGAINNKSVITLNGTMYIMHRTGIYRYGGGTKPSRDFSQPVQWYMDNLNQTAISKCCAGTDGQKLYFSIPVSSSTTTDTVLVYDPEFDAWSVWNDFTALHMVQTASTFHFGMNDGKVIQLGGTTDNGAAITWERISKPFSAEQMSRKIRWTRMWLVADVPAGSTLNVYVSPSATGNSDWVSAGSIAPQTGVQSARIIFTPQQTAQSNYMRVKFSGTGPVTVREWDRDEIDFPIV
ncbi:hypothetical protein [Paenibacillus silvisoli]|uniref:hypothetical protein n=1 Tax=Paenibacillus silvisoli TaxID=3110539 RepID=UPI002805DBB3|nr:hypothetical protein [Paenibacillus silvisoli]